MTSGHPLRRALARVCSTKTMARVVDPIFADMRWEDGRVTARGIASVSTALAVHTLTSIPAWALAACSQDDYAIPKAAGFVTAIAVVAALPLLAPPLFHPPSRHVMSPVTFAATLLPQALALTLPASLVLAIPLALRRVQVSGRLIRRTLLLSAAVVAANFVLVEYALPDASQAFREAVVRAQPASAHVELLRGPMETDFWTLRRQIRNLERTRGGAGDARRLEYAYQLRLAIVAAAIPLSLAGLVISGPRRKRVRALVGIGILAGYWSLLAYEGGVVKVLIDRGGFLPEYFCAWAPNAILLVVASAILLSRHSVNRPLSARLGCR